MTQMHHIAAIVYTLLTAGVIAFQIALACGAPWGHLTLGGKFTGALPTKVRAVPVVSAILLAVFTIIVLVRAGLILPEYQATSHYAIWFPVGYTGLGIVMNTITSSKAERNLWAPVNERAKWRKGEKAESPLPNRASR